MKEFTFTVQDEAGIHARPAGLLVKKAGEFSSAITLCKGSKCADAKKIFSVMALGARRGDEIRVEVGGDDEENATREMKAFLNENL